MKTLYSFRSTRQHFQLCVLFFSLSILTLGVGTAQSFESVSTEQKTQRTDLLTGQPPTNALPNPSFVERQLHAYKHELAQAEAKVQAFKKYHAFTSLADQQQLLLEQRKELDTLLKETANNISGLDTKLIWLKKQITKIPAKVPLSSVTNQQQIIQEAQKNLLDLEIKEQEYLTKYQANSRAIQSVQKEIQLVENFLKKQQSAELENMITTGKNPVYQELEIEILRTEAQLVSEQARRNVTHKQILEIDKELQRLNHLEKEFRELLRTVEASERAYEDYLAMVGTTPLHDYRIQVGDLLDVKFFFNPDLNQEATVRPDGKISLQLIGEVMASGQTVEELKALLKQRYENELKNPSITVILRSFTTNIDTRSRATKHSR
ncbi:MAG: hypothetical protein NPIRA02_23350 [Nitrospirales bacterium]|nr:MAG: hypothetical protein NPIRA02_23350 [Nitrospirales bacterium]